MGWKTGAFVFHKTHFKLLQRYKRGCVNNSSGHFKANMYLVCWKCFPNIKKYCSLYSSDHKNPIICPENWSFITHLSKTWNQLVKWNLSHTLYHLSILFLFTYLEVIEFQWEVTTCLNKQFFLQAFRISKAVLLCKSILCFLNLHILTVNSVSCCVF